MAVLTGIVSKTVPVVLLLLVSSVAASATANCFAHTSISYTFTSAPMDDTGATVLIAFTASYTGYAKIMDVVGGPNKWYHFNPITSVANLNYIEVNIAINPVTNTAATFKHWAGSSMADAGSIVYACNGLNVQDLINSVTTVTYSYPMIAPLADSMLDMPTEQSAVPSAVSPRAGYSVVGSITGGMQGSGYGGVTVNLTDATTSALVDTTTTNSSGAYTFAGVANGSYTVTPTPLGAPNFPGQTFRPVNQAVTVNNANGNTNPFASNVTQCQAGPAISPSAPGDLEFAVFAYSGVSQPGAGTTATNNDPRFSAATIVGGANGGLQGTVGVTWRVATDTSTFQPQWTISVPQMWMCANVTLKADTSPAVSLGNPLFHTVVGNGYQDYTGDGGPPTQAALNWPSDLLWYKHNVPADKILVFVDNQNNTIRAVNYDTAPHTILGVTIAPNTIKTVAGTWAARDSVGAIPITSTCTGDGGPAISATMAHPVGMAEDSQGNLAIADQQCATINKVDTNGIFTWIVGGCAQHGTCTGTVNNQCGGPTKPYHGNVHNVLATQALTNCPQGVAFDLNDNVLVADTGNRIVEIVNTHTAPINAYGVSNIQPGFLVPIVGTGGNLCTINYTPRTGLSASIQGIRQISVDTKGNFYFGIAGCEQMAKVDTSGNIAAVIGQSTITGYSPDGTPANQSLTANPFRMEVGPNGLIYFTDTGANEIRHIDASGNLKTDFGSHQKWGPKFGYGGGGWYKDDISASSIMLDYPIGFTFDSAGRFCISSLMSNVIGCLYDSASTTTATCFAHTSFSVANVSPPMDDTGATVLVAFTSAYAGYAKVQDVVGGPNTWYLVGNWGIGSTTGVSALVAINPITNPAATFKVAGGQSTTLTGGTIWACKGINVHDLVYAVSGTLELGNSGILQTAVDDQATTIVLQTASTAQNGDILKIGTEYMQVTNAGDGKTMVVTRGVWASQPAAHAAAVGVAIGVTRHCQAPVAIGPSAVGDLEFTATGRAGSGMPGTTWDHGATNDGIGFSAPVVIGGANVGNQASVAVAWKVATDMSTFQPTWTMSASDAWTCANIVLKSDTTIPVSVGNPFVHTVVGNGYQNNSLPPSQAGDGGDPKKATLNWPSEMLWYKHGVPADKVLVFVDNQANTIRAVNFDTVAHTVANVVIAPNTIQTIAGTGSFTAGAADGGCTGDGGPALSATLLHPAALAEDSKGNLAIGDQQCASIDIVDTAGNFHWAVGGGSGGHSMSGCGFQLRHGNRVNVLATNALLACPQGVDYDKNDNLIIEDYFNYRIVFANMGTTPVNAYGVSNIQPGYVVTIAGAGANGCTATYAPKPALSVQLHIISIFVDRPTGDVYFGSTCSQIMKLTAAGTVMLLAGVEGNAAAGILGHSPDGTPVAQAQLYYPFRATLEADGLVHFTDTGGNEIRHIDAAGKLQTDMGNNEVYGPSHSPLGPKLGYMGGGWYGEDWSAKLAALNYPIGYAYKTDGTLCASSLMSNVILCDYTASPVILTVTKTGSGTITSSDGHINCGTTCGYGYIPGTSVTLHAAPTAGEQFTGWSGDCALYGTADCITGVPVATNAIASFTGLAPTPTAPSATMGGKQVTGGVVRH